MESFRGSRYLPIDEISLLNSSKIALSRAVIPGRAAYFASEQSPPPIFAWQSGFGPEADTKKYKWSS